MDAGSFVGRAPEQVDKFLRTEVTGALKPYAEAIGQVKATELTV